MYLIALFFSPLTIHLLSLMIVDYYPRGSVYNTPAGRSLSRVVAAHPHCTSCAHLLLPALFVVGYCSYKSFLSCIIIIIYYYPIHVSNSPRTHASNRTAPHTPDTRRISLSDKARKRDRGGGREGGSARVRERARAASRAGRHTRRPASPRERETNGGR